MSTFADLRAQRQSKTSKSFATSSGDDIKAQNATGRELVAGTNAASPSALDNCPPNVGGLYACLPDGLELRTTTASGRGLYVPDGGSVIAPGEIIFKTRPHVYVLSTRNLASHCSTCAASGESLKRCPTCKVLHYCNADCQNRDWATHKKECAALVRWAAGAPNANVAVPAEPIRALGRWLWARQKHKEQSVWTREMNSMQSHRTSLAAEAAEAHTHLAHAVIRYLGLNAPSELGPYGVRDTADIVDVMSRFTTNALSLTSPALTPLGVVVSPAVALLNHACAPNAVVVFPRAGTPSEQQAHEPLMQVVAIRQIQPGEEIFTAYIDTTLPRVQRQAALKTTYNFICACAACSLPRSSDPRESHPCPRAPACRGACAFPVAPDDGTDEAAQDAPACSACGTASPDPAGLADLLRVAQDGLDKAYSLQISDAAQSLKLCTKLLPLLVAAGCPPASHPRLALTRLRQALLLDRLGEPSKGKNAAEEAQNKLDEACRAAAASVDGLCGVLTPGHPIRALAWAEYGKLLSVDEPAPRGLAARAPVSKALTGPGGDPNAGEGNSFPPSGPQRLRLARDVLVRARDELFCAFAVKNEGGDVGKDVRESIVQIERELDVWVKRGALAREDARAK